jgi:hypothetical protein
MVDLCALATDYYYVYGSGGSLSINRLLTPTMNASVHLKVIYRHPCYNSTHFVNVQLYQQGVEGHVIDSYTILSAMNQVQDNNDEDTNEEVSLVTHEGRAATAFHKLQFNSDLSEQECRNCESLYFGIVNWIHFQWQ